MSDSYVEMLSQYDLFCNSLFGLIARNRKTGNFKFMNGYEFERSLVELFVEFTKKKGLKAKPLAMTAWPDRKDAGTKWRKIRNGDSPRELTVRDAYDLSAALGVSFTEMCGIVQGRAIEAEIS